MSNAYETAAEALDTAAKALRAVAAAAPAAVTFSVGDVINSRDALATLPVGMRFEDRDGDRYQVVDSPGNYDSSIDPGDYLPCTLRFVPTPVVQTAASPGTKATDFNVGNRVSLTGVSILGANVNGKTGKVVRVSNETNEVVVAIDGTPDTRRMMRPHQVTLITAAVPSSNLTTYDHAVGDRVRGIGDSLWGGKCDGLLGTVKRVNHSENEVEVDFDGVSGFKLYRPDRLIKVAPPASTRLTLTSDRTNLVIEPSAVDRNGAFLHMSESGVYGNEKAMHLSKADTVRLIASLQAIVDAPARTNRY